jgi:hypothetical protein
MRFHAENPELSEDELTDAMLAYQHSTRAMPAEMLFKYECRQCLDDVYISAEQHARYLTFSMPGAAIGPRSPKCGRCWM